MRSSLPIVAIHGAPRSGTTWLGQLFNSSPRVAYRYQPLFSYAFRGRIDAASGAPELHRFFGDLLATEDPFVMQTGNASLASAQPGFQKGPPTHLVYKEVRFHDVLPHLLSTIPSLKAIGLVRDPRAVIASWSRAPREFDPAWTLADEWRHAARKNAGRKENWFGFERWTELANCFLHLEREYTDRFLLVRHEDLVRSPITTLRDMFDFCDLEVGSQTIEFLKDSSTVDDGDPYGVFRKHDALRSVDLDEDIRVAIESDLRNTPLARFLAENDDRHPRVNRDTAAR